MPRQNRYHPYARPHHQLIDTSLPSGAPPLLSPRYPQAPSLVLQRRLALPAISENAPLPSYQCMYPSYLRRSVPLESMTHYAPSTMQNPNERALCARRATAAAAGMPMALGKLAGSAESDTLRPEGVEHQNPSCYQRQARYPRSTTPLSQHSDASSGPDEEGACAAGSSSGSDEDAAGEEDDDFYLFTMAAKVQGRAVEC